MKFRLPELGNIIDKLYFLIVQRALFYPKCLYIAAKPKCFEKVHNGGIWNMGYASIYVRIDVLSLKI